MVTTFRTVYKRKRLKPNVFCVIPPALNAILEAFRFGWTPTNNGRYCGETEISCWMKASNHENDLNKDVQNEQIVCSIVLEILANEQENQ